MKRWVCKNDDGSLSMTATSGFEPAHMLCQAEDAWIVDELSYSDGIVFIDPAKVRDKEAAKAREDEIRKYDAFIVKVQRQKAKLKAAWPKYALGLAIVVLAYIFRTSLFHFGP